MAGERAGHVLQTTALINEAYARLIDWKKTSWQDRAHYFGISAGLMRRVLVDFARQHPRLAPGREARQVSLEEATTISRDHLGDFVAPDDAQLPVTGYATPNLRRSRGITGERNKGLRSLSQEITARRTA